jgi:hypothetical protein
MASATIHVIPANGRWAVEIEGESASRSEHRIQLVAIMYGRELARLGQARFVIHGRDGQVRSIDSYMKCDRSEQVDVLDSLLI